MTTAKFARHLAQQTINQYITDKLMEEVKQACIHIEQNASQYARYEHSFYGSSLYAVPLIAKELRFRGFKVYTSDLRITASWYPKQKLFEKW